MYPNINQFIPNSLFTKINSLKLNSIKINFHRHQTKHTLNRKRSVIEDPSGSQNTRRSKTVRCGNCKEFRHNILGCQRDKSKKQVRYIFNNLPYTLITRNLMFVIFAEKAEGMS